MAIYTHTHVLVMARCVDTQVELTVVLQDLRPRCFFVGDQRFEDYTQAHDCFERLISWGTVEDAHP